MHSFLPHSLGTLLEGELDVEAADPIQFLIHATRMLDALDELTPLELRLIRWRHGVGCTRFTDQHIARRLGLPLFDVLALGEGALAKVRLTVAGARLALFTPGL